jgi:hypothetical protein
LVAATGRVQLPTMIAKASTDAKGYSIDHSGGLGGRERSRIAVGRVGGRARETAPSVA